MNSYVFQSDITKRLLPAGVTSVQHVTREEASKYLSLLPMVAKREFADWAPIFISTRIERKGPEIWGVATLSRQLKHLEADIHALQDILIVSQAVKEEQTNDR